MSETKMYICGCVRNTGTYLHDVFKNIENICSLLNDYHIIIAYDKSEDDSLNILKTYAAKYKNKFSLLIGPTTLSDIRTENIANARNQILDEINNLHYTGFDYFIMMDMDDVCAKPINIEVLKYVLNKETTEPLSWDALSFNRRNYYDIWALSIYPYTFSLYHYQNRNKLKQDMKNVLYQKFTQEIKRNGNDGLVDCISAFNGFAIYKTKFFSNIKYEWNVKKLLEIYPKSNIDIMSKQVWQTPISRLDDCEHRYFHIRASKQNKARICISPMILFDD